ncbi:MAG: T9SS type A sorting domain-containing protein [Flavobacteriales bacterium]|nr:T9SS type A sorting domain-containing protein [Flavobacteriales bacterium]
MLLRPAFNYTTDGLTVLLADSSTTFGQSAQVSYSYGDGSSATTDSSHAYQQPGTYTVCLTLSTTTLDCSATFCRQVVVPLNACAGISAHFSASGAGTNAVQFLDLSIGASAGERLWEFGDDSTSTEEFPSHIWLLPGPHFVSLTRTLGECSATYGQWVAVDGNASTCGQDLFVDFEPTHDGLSTAFQPTIVANNVIPVLEIWSYGDGNVDTAFAGFNEFVGVGEYQTCLLVGALRPSNLDTCFSLVCRTMQVSPLSMIDEPEAPSLHAWPNPFTNEVFVEVGATASRVRLMDPLGRVVGVSSSRSADMVVFSGTTLVAGTYFVEVDTPLGRLRRAVIKAQ